MHSDPQYDVLFKDERVGPPLTITVGSSQFQVGRPPHIKQWAFFDRTEREQLYGGSKSGGKSVSLCDKIIMYSMAFPGNRVGLFRQDLTDLKGSTLVTFEKLCPKEFIKSHHKTDRLITFINDTVLHYTGLGDIHTFESAKGKEFGAFAIDEPSEVDFEVYMQMTAQLRWVLPDGTFPPYQVWLGSNPEPGWLEDHFGHLIKEATEDCPIVTDGTRVYIMALPKDNPYNPPNYEQILRDTADIPDSWIKKYLEGSWEASEGQVFKEFDRNVHVISIKDVPLDYLKNLTLIGSLDHASTGVVCFTITGVDPRGNLVVLASHYAKSKLLSEHSTLIKDLAAQWVTACGKKDLAEGKAQLDPSIWWAFHAFDYVLIDPSTQAKTQQNRNELWSIQDMYRREGIPTVPAWNALESGIHMLEEYIHIKPHRKHPFTNKSGSPSLFVIGEYNRDGIKEIVSWRRTITINKSIRYVGSDHWIDNVRYTAMSRPEPPDFVGSQLGVVQSAHDKLAAQSLQGFDKKFGKSDTSNQWFPGGRGPADGQWFPRAN